MVSPVLAALRPVLMGGFVAFLALSPISASAQEGMLMRNMLGKLGLFPEEKDPIEYRERPGLVVPKDLNRLPTPENEDAAKRQANAQWPRDPDVLDRERERQRRNMPILAPLRSDPAEGGRLSVNELAAGRSTRGAKVGEGASPRNDYDGVRAPISEMLAGNRTGTTPTYPPGTEPPRRYLTDPPTGLRIPSANARVGRATSDGPAVDRFKVDDAWRRLD